MVPTTKPVEVGNALGLSPLAGYCSGLHDCTERLTSRWTPQSSFGGGEHALQYQKQKHKNSVEHTPAPVNCAATTPCPAPLWPPSQTPCPRLTSQPARSPLSLLTRCPPDTAHGRGQLNSHCSPHRVRSLVGHHHRDFHPELSNPDPTAPTGPNQTGPS